jgi:multiple sugar transport system permease protein
MTSIVAVAITWRYLLDPGTGLVNAGLARLGIEGPDWLGAPATTMPSIIALTVWRNAGESMVIFLAAFRALDPDLDRAARMDGARAWQRFRFVTWPSLRPAVLFCCIVTSIAYLHVFDEPYVMTGPNGGPGQAGFTASMFVYQQGFRFFDLGYASAAACTLFALVAVLSVAQLRLLRSRP